MWGTLAILWSQRGYPWCLSAASRRPGRSRTPTDAVAQFNLGVMYAKGVSPNHAEAALWYRRAADHGLAGAQINLGIMYAEGQGVSQDYAVDARDRVASQSDAAADRRGAGIGI